MDNDTKQDKAVRGIVDLIIAEGRNIEDDDLVRAVYHIHLLVRARVLEMVEKIRTEERGGENNTIKEQQYELLKDILYEISFQSVSGYNRPSPIFFTIKAGSICEYFKWGDCFNFPWNIHKGFTPHLERETVINNPEWFKRIEDE